MKGNFAYTDNINAPHLSNINGIVILNSHHFVDDLGVAFQLYAVQLKENHEIQTTVLSYLRDYNVLNSAEMKCTV